MVCRIRHATAFDERMGDFARPGQFPVRAEAWIVFSRASSCFTARKRGSCWTASG